MATRLRVGEEENDALCPAEPKNYAGAKPEIVLPVVKAIGDRVVS
jgi:hypothetical protein